MGHLLKWEYQSQNRSRSWLATIRTQRRDLLRLLKDNPSLNPDVDEALNEAYENARDLAMGETNLPEQTFPLICLLLAKKLWTSHLPRPTQGVSQLALSYSEKSSRLRTSKALK